MCFNVVEDKASNSNICLADNLTTASDMFNTKVNLISLDIFLEDVEDKVPNFKYMS
jgi:hypothetical protein